VELAGEVELLGLVDSLSGHDTDAPREHQFSLYGNVMFLDAEIESSASPAFVGNTPQYAPDYLVRAGLIYRWKDRAKIAFTGTFVDDHFADDANTTTAATSRFIPGYQVFDLTFEWKVWRRDVDISLIAGINNLFDQDYYARIRPDGIDPAYGRNYYVGASFGF
jgi:Fe(3+) dicitrate transport protein